MLTTKFSRNPSLGPLGSTVSFPPLGVVSQVHKVADGDLLRLEVTNVDDPDTASISVVSQSHLLCGLLELDSVDPFVVSGVANVIEMVVNTSATGTISFIGEGEATDVAPVIVCPQKSDIFGNAEATLLVGLNFLVETPQGGDVGQVVNLEAFTEDLSLIVDKSLQHIDDAFDAEIAFNGCVTCSSHRHGPHAVSGIWLGS
ncbi:hypothetical protein HG530_010938 [Fusarium avenaceum]|nr:hypothetical protein HG530_010938 [Fusarium avenaceum]